MREFRGQRRWRTVFKKVAGILFALTLGLSSGWILRGQAPPGTIALVYYWKAKPGKLEDYNRYIKTVGEPIDFEAQRADADESKRKANADLATTLRDPVSHEELEILK